MHEGKAAAGIAGSEPSYQLPQRSTRGLRMRAAIDDEEEAADKDFWNQEFFAEEAADVDFEPEKERASDAEDVPDSDFDESEDDDDEGGEEVDERPRKKILRPPGYIKPTSKSAGAAVAAAAQAARKEATAADAVADMEAADEGEGSDTDGGAGLSRQAASAGPVAEAPVYQAPQLRRSTVQRAVASERERERKDKANNRRAKPKSSDWRPLTQQELLAEAARTEVENLQSLRALLAMEEEVKRRAVVVKKKYAGPLVRYHSRRVRDQEQSCLTVCNMAGLPRWMRGQEAPPPARQPMCVITHQPARYRDPRTGLPFASAAAYSRLHGRPREASQAAAPALDIGFSAIVPAPVAPQHPQQAPVRAWHVNGGEAPWQQDDQQQLQLPQMLQMPKLPAAWGAAAPPTALHQVGARRPNQQYTEASLAHCQQLLWRGDGPGVAAGDGALSSLEEAYRLPPHMMALIVDLHSSLTAVSCR